MHTQWQLLRIFFHSVARNDYLSVQQQLLVDCLLAISDVLYCRTCGEASRYGPLRANLPIEVVMVSTYVTPVISSFMMQLELTLEIPGVTTSLMGMVPMGVSRSTSMSSGIDKQAVTLEKPHGGVGSCMSANACAGREG